MCFYKTVDKKTKKCSNFKTTLKVLCKKEEKMQKIKIVIKIGGALNTLYGVPHKPFIWQIARQIKDLIDNGYQIILVVSGAIPVGVTLSGDKKIKKTLEAWAWYSMQGQAELANEFIIALKKQGVSAGQGLYTRKTLNNEFTKKVFLYALEKKGVIICNENDAVNPEELEQDNDFLAAKIAILIEAQSLIILSKIKNGIECSFPDYKGKFTCKDGIIRKIESSFLTPEFIKKINNGKISRKGSHGLETKLKAAKMGAEKGIKVRILPGEKKNILRRVLLFQKEIGTLITP